MLEFTDTQTPKGQMTFTYEGLQNQVDDAFGKGYFARSTNVYSKSREGPVSQPCIGLNFVCVIIFLVWRC